MRSQSLIDSLPPNIRANIKETASATHQLHEDKMLVCMLIAVTEDGKKIGVAGLRDMALDLQLAVVEEAKATLERKQRKVKQ